MRRCFCAAPTHTQQKSRSRNIAEPAINVTGYHGNVISRGYDYNALHKPGVD